LQEKNIGWDIPLDQQEKFADAIDAAARMQQKEYDEMSKTAFRFASDYVNNKEIVEQNRHLFIV
jgi:hypothetical protein